MSASTSHGRLWAWGHVLRTTNAPAGHDDKVTRWLVITRSAVLPLTIGAGLVAGALAVGQPGFDWRWYVLAFLGILLAHIANNLMNDIYDARAGSDTVDYPRLMYAPHPTLSGMISVRSLYIATFIVNLLDLAILVTLTVARGWPVLAFGLSGFLLSFAYTTPPLRLKKHGLGEPDVFVTWGPLMIAGMYFSAVGTVSWRVAIAAIPTALLVTTVLMGKHTDKIPWDSKAGIRTIPVLLGADRARLANLILMLGFYVAVIGEVIAGIFPAWALVALAGLVWSLPIFRVYLEPAPPEKPRGFPVWPLWFAANAFLQACRAGGLLVLGLGIALIQNRGVL